MNKKHGGKRNAESFSLFIDELENHVQESFLVEVACKLTENRLWSRKILISTSGPRKTSPRKVNYTCRVLFDGSTTHVSAQGRNNMLL